LAYNLVYHADVEKVDLPRIDKKNKFMIKRAIEDRLKTQPEIYGKPSFIDRYRFSPAILSFFGRS
jgi:mRNA interferase RelE/StbE